MTSFVLVFTLSLLGDSYLSENLVNILLMNISLYLFTIGLNVNNFAPITSFVLVFTSFLLGDSYLSEKCEYLRSYN